MKMKYDDGDAQAIRRNAQRLRDEIDEAIAPYIQSDIDDYPESEWRDDTRSFLDHQDDRYDDEDDRDDRDRGYIDQRPPFWRRRVAVLGTLGAAGFFGIGGIKDWMSGNDYVPAVQIVQQAPAVLKPFQPRLQTCFGLVTTVMKFEAVRENDIPLPLFPDLPWTDDWYYMTAPVQSELCLQGTYEATVTPDALNITIDQSNDIILNRPAIHAMCDSPRAEECLSISGHLSNGSLIVGALPFTSGDEPDLIVPMLRAAEVQGHDPSCLSAAMATPGLGLYDIIVSSLAQDALDQGITQPVRLTLLDADGNQTGTWDARPQRAEFERQRARLASSLRENYDVTFGNECDVSGWGVAADQNIHIVEDDEPIYPTPTGSTEPNPWTNTTKENQ